MLLPGSGVLPVYSADQTIACCGIEQAHLTESVPYHLRPGHCSKMLDATPSFSEQLVRPLYELNENCRVGK
jgi:hypothetical protein